MEDRQNSGGSFESTYNKLISQDEFSTDESPLDSNQDKQKVFMSMVGPEFGMNRYRLLAVSLAVLAVILLAVDIGLGVYYRKLTAGYQTITDITSEVARLQNTYNAAIQNRDEAKKLLEKELSEQKFIKWELEHQNRRGKEYEKQSDKLQMEIAALKSHLPLIKEGCRHCLPGWTLINSMCYYLPFSEAINRKSWLGAREFCKLHGADLAVIDSREKHMAISELINHYNNPLRSISQSGFWIGLRDAEEEGIWKWLDGTRLAEGYWNVGEPNDQSSEDCVATYPRSNPFYAWNDVSCDYNLKWICEMAPRSAT